MILYPSTGIIYFSIYEYHKSVTERRDWFLLLSDLNIIFFSPTLFYIYPPLKLPIYIWFFSAFFINNIYTYIFLNEKDKVYM